MNKDIPEGHHEIVVGNVGTILTTDRSRWWEEMTDGPEGVAGCVGRNIADIYARRSSARPRATAAWPRSRSHGSSTATSTRSTSHEPTSARGSGHAAL